MKTFKSKRRPRIVRLMALLALLVAAVGGWLLIEELRPRWAFDTRFECVLSDSDSPLFFKSKDDEVVWWLFSPPSDLGGLSEGRRIALGNALSRLAFETKCSLLLQYSHFDVYELHEFYWPLQHSNQLEIDMPRSSTTFEEYLPSLEDFDIRIEKGFEFDGQGVLVVKFGAGIEEREGLKPELWDYALCEDDLDDADRYFLVAEDGMVGVEMPDPDEDDF